MESASVVEKSRSGEACGKGVLAQRPREAIA